MKAGSMVVGMVFLWTAGGAARAEVLAGGLAGLDADLNGTGRVGDPWQRSEVSIAAPNIPAPTAARSAQETAPRAERDDRSPAPRLGDLLEQEYRQTDIAVSNCRVEVARRRQVAPARLAAGTVLLRFTVEKSGRVRNAEAISEANTDLELAACAKRVLSDWHFAKHDGGDITVERVYRFAEVGNPGGSPLPR